MNVSWAWLLSVGGMLLKAALIVIVGHFVIKLIVKLAEKSLKKFKIDYSLERFIVKTANVTLHVIVFISAISALGISTTGLLAAVSAVAVGIGLALKDSLSSIAGGILLLISPRFHTGDTVDIDGDTGKVIKIDLMHTILRTFDNRDIVIPNSVIINNRVINFSMQSKRRVDMTFSIAFDNDLKAAKKAISDTISAHPLVLKDEEIFIRVGEYTSSSVNIIIRVWSKTSDYWTVYHDLLEQVRAEFDKQGIKIPFNQLDVHISNNE